MLLVWKENTAPRGAGGGASTRPSPGTQSWDRVLEVGRARSTQGPLGPVGPQKPGISEPCVFSGTDPLENIAFDLKPWRKLLKLSNEVKITGV